MAVRRHALCALLLAALLAPPSALAQVTTLFTDNFTRADSGTIGNGWTERETTGAAVRIANNRLQFSDASDAALRPMVAHAFPAAASGVLEWQYRFDWRRTRSERTYAVYMQLGSSAQMRSDSLDAGVGVNLVWGAVGGVDQALGYRSGGIEAAVAPVAGVVTIGVRADLDRLSYDIDVNGTRVQSGIPFALPVALDRIRFFTHRLNEQNFGGRTFDTVSIVRQAPAGGNAPPAVPDRAFRVGDGVARSIVLSYTDNDGPGPYVFDVVQGPQHGTLGDDDGDGTLIYTAASPFIGVDSFTYRVSDGIQQSNSATVTLRVQHFPGAAWQTRTPAQAGLDAAALDRFVAAVGGVGSIVKDGYMVRTWGDQLLKSDWASAAKPVINTLLFFAVDEALIPSLEMPIETWVAAATGGALTAEDRTMTFWHLTNGVSGYARAEAPGEAWAYNDVAIALRNRLVQTLYAGPLDAPLRARLAPLHLQDGSLLTTRGGYGVSTTTRDFARIGWFWLNSGNWNGSQLVSESLFDAYMKPQVPGTTPRSAAADADYLAVGSTGGGTDQTPFGPGIFGMNWWFNDIVGNTGRRAWPDAPADTVLAIGHFNRELVVMIPSLNMVIANRGAWGTFEPGNPSSGLNQRFRLLMAAVQTAAAARAAPDLAAEAAPREPRFLSVREK